MAKAKQKSPTAQALAERFWSKVDCSGGPDACWLWTDSLANSGYGELRINGRNVKAHRFMWTLHCGELSVGASVGQTCENKACVNLKHLALSNRGMGRTLEARFLEKVNKHGPLWEGTPCWLWTAVVMTKAGYGSMGVGGRKGGMRPAHRVAWELYRGSIPDGLDIDHLCRVRRCVNPDHLEPVTRAVNIRRGDLCARTHCPHGHPYSVENVFYDNGWRKCRLCVRARCRAYSKKLYAKAKA